MAQPRDVKKIPITWDGDGYSQTIQVADFRDVVITVVGTGDIQVLGSIEKPNDPVAVPVDFSVASTIDNAYAAVVLADLTTASNSYVTTLTVTDETKLAEINTNLLTYICVTRSANTVDAFITVCDNS